MTYLPEESKVTYQYKACPRRRSENGKEGKVFDALEWLAAMTSHVPNRVAPIVSISVKIISGVKQSGIPDTAIRYFRISKKLRYSYIQFKLSPIRRLKI
jgi:hypothetical protein